MRILTVIILFLGFVLPAHSQLRVTPIKAQKTVFSINAADEKTAAELPAKFTVKAHQARKTFEGKSAPGQPYVFILNRTDTLTIVTQVSGYYEAEEVMVVSCDTCPDYGYTVLLEKEDPKADSIFRNLQVNQAFRLDNVYFDQSSYILRPESFPQLNKLVKTLTATPSLVIEIAGHTDNVGDRRLNLSLSENRAKVIRGYLTQQGIAENRLRASGYGDTRPAAPNDSEDNKRKNRRVEFVVLAL